MSDPFLGEVRIFSFDYAPAGWALCQGQTLPMNQYTALYSLLGSRFGGDGINNFGLPNLTGACAIGQGQGPNLSPYNVGDSGGQSSVTLSPNNMGYHEHDLICTTVAGTTTKSQGNLFAKAVASGGSKTQGDSGLMYNVSTSSPPVTIAANSIGAAGGGQSHPNMMPSLVLNFSIALTGAFPQRP